MFIIVIFVRLNKVLLSLSFGSAFSKWIRTPYHISLVSALTHEPGNIFHTKNLLLVGRRRALKMTSLKTEEK